MSDRINRCWCAIEVNTEGHKDKSFEQELTEKTGRKPNTFSTAAVSLLTLLPPFPPV
jgi:hypothetical protein